MPSLAPSLARLPGPFAIVGGGVSGSAVRSLLDAGGWPASSLTLFDSVPGRGNYSDPEKLLREFKPGTLIVSPGVPLSSPWIHDFKSAGGKVTSELEVAAALLSGERVVGVTGSVGKSTTVSLLGAGALAFDPHAFVGGNLGVPLAAYVDEVLRKKRPRAQWLVLELSSFQLEQCEGLACSGVAITSLNSNHLERYPSLESYYDTKWKLVSRTRGPVVVNANGGEALAYVEKKIARDAELAARVIFASRARTFLRAADFERAKLIGAHNRDNLAVAAELARACAWPVEKFLGAMLTFAGLAHRLQDAGEFGGVRFINDSKATAIESVQTAVDAVLGASRAGRVWVLLGGKDKKLPWESLAPLARNARLGFVFFGQCGALAQGASKLPGEVFARLGPALMSLKPLVRPGDIVLLSPGGSSLDEFKKFEERGEYFMKSAREIFT